MAGKKKDTVVENEEVQSVVEVNKPEDQAAEVTKPEVVEPEVTETSKKEEGEQNTSQEDTAEGKEEEGKEDPVKDFDVPEGFALVPLEPTRQQIMQGARFAGGSSRATYKVMIEQYLKDQGK